MRTLKITLEYDGTNFVGWQRQAAGTSVQGLLEDALACLEGAPVPVHGAGRTDAGVHALGQVASACVTCAHDTATLVRALNARLPTDVRVRSVEDAPPDFHARFSAGSKTYRYQIRNAAVASPFERAFVWHVPETLALAPMREAAALLVGTHDFAAFRSAGSETSGTVRTITSSVVHDADGLLVYEVAGDGFLRHMVRAIVGTLVEVGRGRRAAENVARLLHGGPRAGAGPTAPPQGLFLAHVDYQQSPGDLPLLIEFVPQTTLHRERDLVSALPIVRNGPPGTFVDLSNGLRVSLPTDQVVFADDTGGRAQVAFGGMRFAGVEDGRLIFHRARELRPEAELSPARSHTMVLDPDWVSSIHAGGRRVWPA